MHPLYHCPLFAGLPTSTIDHLLAQGQLRHYAKGDIVALQGSPYQHLLLVASGKLRGEMVNHAGELIVIEEIPSPRAVAPAILYASNNALPVNIVAMEPTQLLAIDREQFTRMMQEHEGLLVNFMQTVANRSRFLTERLRLMRFGTIRSKLATYLLDAIGQHGGCTTFAIAHTQQELADMFGVTRPALARALAQMIDEGIVSSARKAFVVHKVEALRQVAG